MLVNQQNPNILPLRREPLKRRLNIRRLGLSVYDEEVLLRVWRGRDVLGPSISFIYPPIIPFPFRLCPSPVVKEVWINVLRLRRGEVRLLSPMHHVSQPPGIGGGCLYKSEGKGEDKPHPQ